MQSNIKTTMLTAWQFLQYFDFLHDQDTLAVHSFKKLKLDCELSLFDFYGEPLRQFQTDLAQHIGW